MSRCFRRAQALLLAALLLSALVPSASAVRRYMPLPELLRIRQTNQERDLGNQRRECRTYPETLNETVNAVVSAAVDEMAEFTLSRIPSSGQEVMSWADTGATVTVTGTKTASFFVFSHLIHKQDQYLPAFRTFVFDLSNGRQLTLSDLFSDGAGVIIRAAIMDQLSAYYPDTKADPETLASLADAWRDTPFTLTPAYLAFHYSAWSLYPEQRQTLMHVHIPYAWLTGYMTDYALSETDNSRYLLAAPTFDDGPCRGITASVLFTLRKYGAAATFFNNGPQMGNCPDYVRWEHDAGCAVQSHTWSHTVGLTNKGVIMQEKAQLESLQVSMIGLKPAYMRSPGGIDPGYAKAKVGLPIIRWNCSTYDAVSDYSLSHSLGVMNSTLTETAVILAHNLAQHSRDNCDQMLRVLQEQGYMTVTVDELFRIRGVQLKVNTVYEGGEEPDETAWQEAEVLALLGDATPGPTIAPATPTPSPTPAPTAIPVSLPVKEEAAPVPVSSPLPVSYPIPVV